MIQRESLSEDEKLTGGQLFGFALLKFFTVFVGSISIGAAISMLTALLFKVKYRFFTYFYQSREIFNFFLEISMKIFFLNINIWCLEKCGLVLSELDYDRDRSNCTSIEMQNIHLSPEGNFYIHYDNYPRFDDSGELIDDHSPDLTDIEPLDGVPDYIDKEPNSTNYKYVDEMGRGMTDSLLFNRSQ